MKISILGCGWLGTPLGKSLQKSGFTVKGSVRNKDEFSRLQKNEITPYLVSIHENKVECEDDSFFDADILIISLPPGRNKGTTGTYVKRIEVLIDELKNYNITNVIYLSSTSVYGNNNGIVNEDHFLQPESASGLAIKSAEEQLVKAFSERLCVIRLAGLFGPERDPMRFVEKVIYTRSGNTPVNLISQSECIRVLHFVIENNLWGEAFNAVLPEHPTRSEFYGTLAQRRNLTIPSFVSMEREDFKSVSGKKLEKLGFNYNFKNPIDYV